MKSRGLSTPSSLTSTLKWNCHWIYHQTHTRFSIFSISRYGSITHSPTTTLLIVYQKILLDTRLKAFSKSTKAKYMGFCCRRCFSCNYNRMEIASVVLLPHIKPNCMLSISTWDLITESRTLSIIFFI